MLPVAEAITNLLQQNGSRDHPSDADGPCHPRETRKMRRASALFCALASLVVVGCSPAGSDAVSGSTVTIAGVDVPLSFEPPEIELEAGDYTIRFRNEGALPHQLAIGEPDDGGYAQGDTGEVAGGQERSFDATLEPGRHAFACYVDRHNEAGMVGTFIVR
jgi:plastocyanin